MNLHAPARRLLSDGTQVWYLDGVLHRTDGPAIVYAEGTEVWCLFGVRHRTDGPAVIRPDGTEVWIYNGVQISPLSTES